MTIWRLPAASLVFMACLLSAACGDPGGQQTTSSSPAGGTPATPAPPPQSGSAPAVVVKRDNPCSVLLPSEVGAILGVPISLREVVDETTCHFVYDDPAPEGTPYFAINVHFTDGRTAVLATRMASGLLGGDAGFERLPDIGDEAWLGPLASTLVFVKGETGIELDLRLVADGREKGIRLAKLVASRL